MIFQLLKVSYTYIFFTKVKRVTIDYQLEVMGDVWVCGKIRNWYANDLSYFCLLKGRMKEGDASCRLGGGRNLFAVGVVSS